WDLFSENFSGPILGYEFFGADESDGCNARSIGKKGARTAEFIREFCDRMNACSCARKNRTCVRRQVVVPVRGATRTFAMITIVASGNYRCGQGLGHTGQISARSKAGCV